MWPLRRINTPPPSPRSITFSCSSFKDVPSLCSDDDRPLPLLHSPVSSPRGSPTVFQRIRVSAPSSFPLRHSKSLPSSTLSREERIVVYFTNLRVVRKTYEDSLAVRSILRGYRVPVDERDLSTDTRYVAELHGLVGGGGGGWRNAIPCVFVGGRRLGGAEEVRRLHESGELREMLLIAGGGGRRGFYMGP